MKPYRGSALLVGLVVFGLFALIGAFLFISYVSANNSAARYENEIKFSWENSKNVLSQYTLKIAEAAQVPAMQRDNLSKVVQEALSARYGKDGSKAVFQFIKEQNPQIDSAVYVKLQQIIEAGRDEFKNTQTRVQDNVRAYQTNLQYFWTGRWMGYAGYPKIDLAQYKVIMSDQATQAFTTGKDQPMKLR